MRYLLPLLLLCGVATAHEGHGTGTQPGFEQVPVVTGTPYKLVEETVNGERRVTLLPIEVTPPTPEPEPHQDDPVKREEHLAAMDLVRSSEATVRPVGEWVSGDPNAVAFIDAGKTATISGETIALKAGVKGTLQLNAGARLSIDTLIGHAGSVLRIGTPENPITPENKVIVKIRDTGPLDPARDPYLLGRGIVWHGTVEINGVPVMPPEKGQPVNLEAYGVVFLSENVADLTRRGHFMLMHKGGHRLIGLLCLNWGRSDKSQPVTDPVPGNEKSRRNPRARYGGPHFHLNALSEPSVVFGCACVNSPGWGFTNHSSNVLVRKCVSVNTFGAAFIAEKGDELGCFDDCVALDIPGVKGATVQDGTRRGTAIDDWGIGGHGLWIHGGNVTAKNFWSERTTGSGIVPIAYGGLQVPLADVREGLPLLKAGMVPGLKPGLVEAGDIPIHIKGAQADAIELWSLHNPTRQMYHRGVLEDCEFGRVMSGYSNRTDYLRVKSVGNPLAPLPMIAWSHTGVTENHQYIDCNVEGYQVGVLAPSDGLNLITGGRYANVVDFLILNKPRSAQANFGTEQVFDGVEFAPLTVDPAKHTPVELNSLTWPATKFPPGRFNFYLAPWMVWFDIRYVDANYPDWQKLFHWEQTFGVKHVIKVRAKGASDFEYLNFPEWSRDYPLPACVPASIREKYPTNGALYDATGCCLWGIVPVSGEVRPGSNGIWTEEPAVFLKTPKVPELEIN